MENKLIYADFARKAKEKMEARKQMRTKKVHIEDLDVTLTLRGITDQELVDVNEYSDDSLKNDKYLIYLACTELQETAKIMHQNRDIEEYIDVVDMFSRADRRELAEQILTLSGIYDETTLKEIEEIKN